MSKTELGKIVYLCWYDFNNEKEYILSGEVMDNSLWADSKYKDQVLVRFRPPSLPAAICHHFPVEKLSVDSGHVPHDDCYLVCGKKTRFFEHDIAGKLKKEEKLNVSDAWQQVQQFKQDHWDYQLEHMDIDALEEFYQLWRNAIAAKRGYLEYPPHPFVPQWNGWDNCVKQQPIAPVIAETIKTAKLIKKQKHSTGKIQYTDSIQTSIFD